MKYYFKYPVVLKTALGNIREVKPVANINTLIYCVGFCRGRMCACRFYQAADGSFSKCAASWRTIGQRGQIDVFHLLHERRTHSI